MGAGLFVIDDQEYLLTPAGMMAPMNAERKKVIWEWATRNVIPNEDIVAGMALISGKDQWYESELTYLQNISTLRRRWEMARAHFGEPLSIPPFEGALYDATVVGACRSKVDGVVRPAVIQFSPPPHMVNELHFMDEYEFFPSEQAVTVEEFKQQKELAYEIHMGSEVINLDAGDGKSISRVGAPFYFWPQEGRVPMLPASAQSERMNVNGRFTFEEAILFFAGI